MCSKVIWTLEYFPKNFAVASSIIKAQCKLHKVVKNKQRTLSPTPRKKYAIPYRSAYKHTGRLNV